MSHMRAGSKLKGENFLGAKFFGCMVCLPHTAHMQGAIMLALYIIYNTVFFIVAHTTTTS